MITGVEVLCCELQFALGFADLGRGGWYGSRCDQREVCLVQILLPGRNLADALPRMIYLYESFCAYI